MERDFLATVARLAPELPPFEREYLFARPRKFRADFAWPDCRLLIELEGGTWSGGKHGIGSGIETDCEKSRFAALNGWRVYRVTRTALRESPLQIVTQLKAIRGAMEFGVDRDNPRVEITVREREN